MGKKSSLSAEERVAMLRERWKLGNRQQRAKFPERERQRYRDWYAANRDEWNAIRRQRYAERKAAKE